ncbi:MAG: hypothetical protein H6Q15_1116 [Bacteroidetes bacterium]|nr:hypothetical protein [Bacteroidota bacterium]
MKLPSQEEKIFIEQNINSDLTSLLLSKNKEIDIKFCAQQIEGYNKAKDKFPSLLSINSLLFPRKINLEQTSSEQTAKYKASLFENKNTISDLSSGFGIDDIFFAKQFKKVYYHERDTELAEIAEYNFKALGINNIEVRKGDSTSDINNIEEVDIIYIDPSRRDNNNNKVFLIQDCQPNIIEILPILLSKAKQICIKLSPMLDIKQAIRDLGNIKEIHIISIRNECKELLLILEKGYNSEIEYHCIDFDSKENINTFIYFSEDISPRLASKDSITKGKYFYEPNTSVLKAGAFNIICKTFPIEKIAPHSHLYISEKEIIDFPGRRFIIQDILPYNNKTIKHINTLFHKANITIRNFPLTVSEIRNKTKIKEGGENYLFFTTNKDNEKIIISCEKI